MNFLIGIMNLLGLEKSTEDLFAKAPDWLRPIMGTLYEIIDSIVIPILIITATVGIIYSIVLGVNYARAETSDQKEEAKKRIINVVVGALLMIVLMLLLYLFIKNAPTIFQWVKDESGLTGGSTAKLISNLFIR